MIDENPEQELFLLPFTHIGTPSQENALFTVLVAPGSLLAASRAGRI